MRRIASLLAVLFLLAVPSAASAGNGYYDVTIGPASPWTSTFEFGSGFTNLGCGQTVGLNPGGTVRVWNGGQGNNNYMHLGLAVLDSAFNVETGTLTDFVTGTETRQFTIYEDPNVGSSHVSDFATFGTRRIFSQFGGTFNTVKFVHQSGFRSLVIKANC